MTLVGQCAICEREIAVRPDSQRLVHHGYARPGIGSIVGDCFAVDLPAHEVSNEAALAYRGFAGRCLADAHAALANLREGHVVTLHHEELVPVPTTALRPDASWRLGTSADPGWTQWPVPYTSTETDPRRQDIWAVLLKAAMFRQERKRDFYTSELVRIERFIAPWAPGTLREREKVVPDPARRKRRRMR